MMKMIMHKMFLSCLKATELIEKKMHFKISFLEKLQLKMHKSMCKACSNYEKQSIIIDRSISTRIDKIDNKNDVAVLKRHIIDLLEKNR